MLVVSGGRSLGRLPSGAVLAIAVTIVLSVLGAAHDPAPKAESAVSASSVASDGAASDAGLSAGLLSSVAGGEPLVACGLALLCALALLTVAARVRRRAGCWPAPVPETTRPVTSRPCLDVRPSPHLCGRLIC